MDIDVADWMTAAEAVAWTLLRDDYFARRMRFAGGLSLVAEARRHRDRWVMPLDAAAPALAHECEQGRIAVTGRPVLSQWNNIGPRAAVGKDEWRDHTFDLSNEFALVHVGSNIYSFRMPAFRRIDVLRALIPPEKKFNEQIPKEDVVQSVPRRGYSQIISSAVYSIWPAGIPAGIIPGDRNRQITVWLKSHKLHVPSDKTFQRYFK